MRDWLLVKNGLERMRSICGVARSSIASPRSQSRTFYRTGHRHKISKGKEKEQLSPLRAYRGRSVFPIRKRSIACAQSRPSRIAHTTSDWPRRMSPAENTFAREVW